MMIVDDHPVRGICDPPGPTDIVHDGKAKDMVTYNKTQVTDYRHTREQDGKHTYNVMFTVPEEFSEAELSEAIQRAVDNLVMDHRLTDVKRLSREFIASMMNSVD